MNNKIDCSIILDLLPLYHDNVVSEETKTVIEKHLFECESCQKEYEVLSMDIQEPSELNTKEKFTDMIKKQKRKQTINVIISVILLCSLFVGGFHFLTNVPLRKVPAEQIEVLKTFKVETTHGDKFVVLYNIVSYNNRLITDIDFNKNTNSIELNIKVPILSHAIPTIYNGTDYAKVEDIRVIDAQDNAETLYYADKV
ncbi:MAG: zf-HC2 domain-containing protein, partial [Oscillospiraceae bacterium]